MDLIITPEEVGVLSRPISQHIDHAQISAYITEVESLQILPNLGASLLADIKANADKYSCLLNGGDGVSGGLRKAVAYYVYAKIIKQGATIATRFGAVEKADEHSVRMEQERKDNIFRECSNIADAYMMEVVKYAKARGWTQARKASAIRRTAFVIGDEPQAQECVATTPTSGGGGGGGTTEGGEIYAGEGINIRDNVISVNMTEVRAGVGIPTIEKNIATVQELADNANKLANDANKLASTANTKSELALTSAQSANNALDGKADKSELANYATTADVSAKADKSELANYATTEALAQKADASALNDKADKSAFENYATKESLANFATKEEVNGLIDTINTQLSAI